MGWEESAGVRRVGGQVNKCCSGRQVGRERAEESARSSPLSPYTEE